MKPDRSLQHEKTPGGTRTQKRLRTTALKSMLVLSQGCIAFTSIPLSEW